MCANHYPVILPNVEKDPMILKNNFVRRCSPWGASSSLRSAMPLNQFVCLFVRVMVRQNGLFLFCFVVDFVGDFSIGVGHSCDIVMKIWRL